MIIKVCGMRDPENIREVAALGVDWIGLIFFARSPRRITNNGQLTIDNGGKRYSDCQLSIINYPLKKVGVFVNTSFEELVETAAFFRLDYLQLHGNETPEDCHALQKRGYSLIKAFQIATACDLEQTTNYEGRVDYFLFDTKCNSYGGSGKQFDWSVLEAYRGKTPFLLSGGIRPESAGAIRSFRHPRLAGIDLNIIIHKSEITNQKMNRITNLFNTKKNGILSVFFTAGYPNLDDTKKILKELENKGIDMVEIGIPFSDPMADGPVIQEASTAALRNGMSLHVLFEQLEDIRQDVHIPIILMGYLNPIMQYGFEAFCRKCVQTGVDGMIIPDLPFADYMADYKAIVDRYDLKMIMLITPETSEERIRLIDEHTSGFIYMVSSASTTGAQQSFNEQKQAYFHRINGMGLRNPRLVGFGISNKATFDAVAINSSGAIIGSKFIQLLKSEPISVAVDKLRAAIQE